MCRTQISERYTEHTPFYVYLQSLLQVSCKALPNFNDHQRIPPDLGHCAELTPQHVFVGGRAHRHASSLVNNVLIAIGNCLLALQALVGMHEERHVFAPSRENCGTACVLRSADVDAAAVADKTKADEFVAPQCVDGESHGGNERPRTTRERTIGPTKRTAAHPERTPFSRAISALSLEIAGEMLPCMFICC